MEINPIISLEASSISQGSDPLKKDLEFLENEKKAMANLEAQFPEHSAARHEAKKFHTEIDKAILILQDAIPNGHLSKEEKSQLRDVTHELHDQIYKIDADIHSGSISAQDGKQLLNYFNATLSLCEKLSR